MGMLYMSDILEKVKFTIKEHSLLEKGDRVLIAISGGADSVCMLNIFKRLAAEYDLELYAAHLNHMLRGDDAEDDECFTRDYCSKLGISFFSKKADVSLFAKEHSLTTEEAGRKLRYSFFDEIKAKENINRIATAHNSDDDVETVLMRFIRGTGITGLAGIPYKTNGIIRPMLDITRREIEDYMKNNGIPFKNDKTNFEPVYFRNIMRLDLIPRIENEYNPNFRRTVKQNIINYKDAADYLKSVTEDKCRELVSYGRNFACIKLSELAPLHSFMIKSVIYTVLGNFYTSKQVTAGAVETVFSLVENGCGAFEFSGELLIFIRYNKLYFIDKEFDIKFTYEIDGLSEVYIQEYDKYIRFQIVDCIKRENNCVFIDYDKVKDKHITIRSRADGDYFSPSGTCGRKKLKSYFIDEKVPRFLRNSVPIITADDEIVCVGSMRVDNKYKVSSDTKRILKIEIVNRG